MHPRGAGTLQATHAFVDINRTGILDRDPRQLAAWSLARPSRVHRS